MHSLRLRYGCADWRRPVELHGLPKTPTSTRRTKLCAARRTAAPGCSCLGLLMDFLDKDLLDKYLLAIPLAKGRLHLSPDAKGSSSTEHCVGGNLLMDLPPMASKCRSPRLLPSTPPWTRTSWMDLLDLLPADMAARLGDLRLDPAPAQRHRLRQVHRQPSQRLRAAARKPAKPQLDTKQVMTSQLTTSSSSSTSWNSMMGPTRGVRWRGGAPPAPPLWKYEQNDLWAYSKFAKKIALWRIQVASFVTPREAALVLYTSLTGKAEAELEHASIESINSDKGIDLILETLRQPMEQKQIFQKRKFLSDFEGIQRQPDEGLKAFSNKYRRIERNLKAVGIEVALMYDSEARGNRLQERARLATSGSSSWAVVTPWPSRTSPRVWPCSFRTSKAPLLSSAKMGNLSTGTRVEARASHQALPDMAAKAANGLASPKRFTWRTRRKRARPNRSTSLLRARAVTTSRITPLPTTLTPATSTTATRTKTRPRTWRRWQKISA